jgi:hypothetical protein
VPRLTTTQRKLIAEIDELESRFTLDVGEILAGDPEGRTPYLVAARDKLIRGQVTVWYTLIDEFLNMKLCQYLFGRKRTFIQLWRTKRFQNFNYFVLERLSLLEKLSFVRAIIKVPKAVVADIERLNSLRNGLSHSLFPQNLRTLKPIWKGKNALSLDGVEVLQADMEKVIEFFIGKTGPDDSAA